MNVLWIRMLRFVCVWGHVKKKPFFFGRWSAHPEEVVDPEVEPGLTGQILLAMYADSSALSYFYNKRAHCVKVWLMKTCMCHGNADMGVTLCSHCALRLSSLAVQCSLHGSYPHHHYYSLRIFFIRAVSQPYFYFWIDFDETAFEEEIYTQRNGLKSESLLCLCSDPNCFLKVIYSPSTSWGQPFQKLQIWKERWKYWNVFQCFEIFIQ